METFLQQIVNGLVLGSVYALVALGYTMVYGVIGLINFAHGEVLMVGAYCGWAMVLALMGVWPEAAGWLLLIAALLTAILVCVALNLGIERVAYRPLRRAPRLSALITAIGVSLLLQTLAMMIFKPSYKAFPPLLGSARMVIHGEAGITAAQLLILLTTALLLALLTLLVARTAAGRAMRAVAENPDAAALMGIHPDRVVALTFALGAALAAVAGVMLGLNYGTVHHAMGALLGLKAFVAAVFGGIGNLPGAVLGGLLLGLIESIGSGYLGDLTGGVLGSHYRDLFAFAVLILVLTVRPRGLLGERVAERA